jgi:hypothetical protein
VVTLEPSRVPLGTRVAKPEWNDLKLYTGWHFSSPCKTKESRHHAKTRLKSTHALGTETTAVALYSNLQQFEHGHVFGS